MSVQTTPAEVKDATPGSAIRVNLSKIIRDGDDVNVYGVVRDATHLYIDELESVIPVRSDLVVEVFA